MSRVTLSRFLIEQTRSNNTPADLRFLIEVVARACKAISHQVSKGALGGVLGSAGSENVQGEVQKKLDIIANDSGRHFDPEVTKAFFSTVEGILEAYPSSREPS